jgi:hypothetical protein
MILSDRRTSQPDSEVRWAVYSSLGCPPDQILGCYGDNNMLCSEALEYLLQGPVPQEED